MTEWFDSPPRAKSLNDVCSALEAVSSEVSGLKSAVEDVGDNVRRIENRESMRSLQARGDTFMPLVLIALCLILWRIW